jgi:hypothetical protein
MFPAFAVTKYLECPDVNFGTSKRRHVASPDLRNLEPRNPEPRNPEPRNPEPRNPGTPEPYFGRTSDSRRRR